MALTFIHRLYEIEESARDLSPEDRRAPRQAYALPVLEALQRWRGQEAAKILPRTPIAKAFAYTLNPWEALCRYVDDGRISIDTNAADRSWRGPGIGKKGSVPDGLKKLCRIGEKTDREHRAPKRTQLT